MIGKCRAGPKNRSNQCAGIRCNHREAPSSHANESETCLAQACQVSELPFPCGMCPRKGIYGNFGIQCLGQRTVRRPTCFAVLDSLRFRGFGVNSRVFTWRPASSLHVAAAPGLLRTGHGSHHLQGSSSTWSSFGNGARLPAAVQQLSAWSLNDKVYRCSCQTSCPAET